MNISKILVFFVVVTFSIHGIAMPGKVVCEFSGLVAPEFPEAYMEIETNSLEVVGFYEFGTSSIAFVDDSFASRQPIDWNLCDAFSGFSDGIFSSHYDCPLSGNLKSTLGYLKVNLKNGEGYYKFNIVAHNDTVSTSLQKLKNCRTQ